MPRNSSAWTRISCTKASWARAFTGRLVRETSVGPYPAVVPTITGSAYVYAIANYMLDPDDPFPEGFTVGDIWSVQNEPGAEKRPKLNS